MTTRRIVGILSLLLLCLPWTVARAQEDIEPHRDCAVCGMDRKAYGYSRALIRFADGASVGTCSLHCAVVEIDRNPARQVKSLLVADRDNRELINAETATWVVGGKKRGVMTRRPKWAFGTGTAAEVFIKAYGGEIVSWPETLDAARRETAGESK